MSSPEARLPRSPGGYLLSSATDDLSRSSSASSTSAFLSTLPSSASAPLPLPGHTASGPPSPRRANVPHSHSTTSSGAHPGQGGGGTGLRRRSNETSGSTGTTGLDYYWSSAAGLGSSSSTSSLAISPSASTGPGGMAISPSGGSFAWMDGAHAHAREVNAGTTASASAGDRTAARGMYRRSDASLRDLIAQEERAAAGEIRPNVVDLGAAGGYGSEEIMNSPPDLSPVETSGSGGSGGWVAGHGARLDTRSGGYGPAGTERVALESPMSGDSDYSPHSENSRAGHGLGGGYGYGYGYGYPDMGGDTVGGGGGAKRSQSGPTEVWAVPVPGTANGATGSEPGGAMSRLSPSRSNGGDISGRPTGTYVHADTETTTPRLPQYDYPSPASAHTTPVASYNHHNPSSSSPALTPRSYPSPSSYVPGSGPLRSAPTSKRPSASGSPSLGGGGGGGGSEPMSAPAWKTDFGGIYVTPSDDTAGGAQGLGVGAVGDDGAETIKGREKRATLPAAAPAAASLSAPNLAAAEPSDARTSHNSGRGERGSDYLSPSKPTAGQGSPQPPPRSVLRTQLAGITSPVPNLSFDFHPGSTSPLNISPRTKDVSYIPSTDHLDLAAHPAAGSSSYHDARGTSGGNGSSGSASRSGAGSRANSDGTPDEARARLAASPARGLSSDSAGTVPSINDLTEMLGGAIDEIGLIDSRETPPPMVAAPEKDKQKDRNQDGGAYLNASQTSTVRPGSDSDRGAEGAGEGRAGGVTPRSLPNRGESLGGTTAPTTLPASETTATTTHPQVPGPGPVSASAQQHSHSHTQSHSSQQTRSTTSPPSHSQAAWPEHPALAHQSGVFVAKPWPAAMLYGHIKNMKHAGDRAKSYARGINELALADSGLAMWCIVASSSSMQNRPTVRHPLKKLSSYASTYVPESPTLSMHSQLPHLPSYRDHPNQAGHQPRTVSSSSEFPMREDSYTAREIHQRVIDPADQPTALPATLPYPQLQQARVGPVAGPPGAGVSGGGMKTSQSVQSVASLGAGVSANTGSGAVAGGGSSSGHGKRGFFSALRGKKDSTAGLGPPSIALNSSTSTTPSGGGAAKKDLRGIAISGPTDLSSAAAARSGTPGPLGPRGPRNAHTPEPHDLQGHYQPHHTHAALGGISRDSLDIPYRSSLDASMARLTPPTSASASRASFETARTSKSSAPPLSGLGGSGASRGGSTTTLPAPTGGGGAGGGGGGNPAVTDNEVRTMQDVLPHVDRGVLRSYLARYGDQMGAISAYLEDEKKGQVRV